MTRDFEYIKKKFLIKYNKRKWVISKDFHSSRMSFLSLGGKKGEESGEFGDWSGISTRSISEFLRIGKKIENSRIPVELHTDTSFYFPSSFQDPLLIFNYSCEKECSILSAEVSNTTSGSFFSNFFFQRRRRRRRRITESFNCFFLVLGENFTLNKKVFSLIWIS